mmetsp:Transcript_30905/g.27333  ORF Transcript_30905/g.27333 Transcript_30905/m.27333 type:complete len:130 (+) Transcript_30905:354-743(+)
MQDSSLPTRNFEFLEDSESLKSLCTKSEYHFRESINGLFSHQKSTLSVEPEIIHQSQYDLSKTLNGSLNFSFNSCVPSPKFEGEEKFMMKGLEVIGKGKLREEIRCVEKMVGKKWYFKNQDVYKDEESV